MGNILVPRLLYRGSDSFLVDAMTDIKELAAELLESAAWVKSNNSCCGELDTTGTCIAPACSFGEVMKQLHKASAALLELEAELDLEYQVTDRHNKVAKKLRAERDKLQAKLDSSRKKCHDALYSNRPGQEK